MKFDAAVCFIALPPPKPGPNDCFHSINLVLVEPITPDWMAFTFDVVAVVDAGSFAGVFLVVS